MISKLLVQNLILAELNTLNNIMLWNTKLKMYVVQKSKKNYKI